MKTILVHTIPSTQQRYPTCGDWLVTDGELTEVRVSEMANVDHEFLVGLHELVEGWLCTRSGITDQVVIAFDRAFEKEREAGVHDDAAEPGDDGRAPYYKQHQLATSIERLLAAELGVDWSQYDKAVQDA